MTCTYPLRASCPGRNEPDRAAAVVFRDSRTRHPGGGEKGLADAQGQPRGDRENPTPRPTLGAGGRFDSLDGSYAITCLAEDPTAAIAETLCRDLSMARAARLIPEKALAGRLLAELVVTGPIEVVSLHGAGLTGVGQDTWLTKSEARDYLWTREWAAAIRRWVPDATGFAYRCRHDEDGYAWALFTEPKVRHHPLLKATGNPLALDSPDGRTVVRRVLARYNATISRSDEQAARRVP